MSKTQHTCTHPFNGPMSGTTPVSRYQKSKTDLDFTEARDSEWQLHQLGHMQVCSRQITTPARHHSVFFQTGCPSCCPTNSVKALKEMSKTEQNKKNTKPNQCGIASIFFTYHHIVEWTGIAPFTLTIRSLPNFPVTQRDGQHTSK